MSDKTNTRLLNESIADTIIAWMIFRKLLRNAKERRQ